MLNISLKLDGVAYKGWTEAYISRSIEQMAGAFRLFVADKQDVRIYNGQACQVIFEGEVLVNGHINRTEKTISEENVSLSLIGRDLSGDLVDCSAVINGGGKLYDLTLSEVIQKLTVGFKVPHKVKAGNSLKHDVSAEHNTIFDVIEKCCRKAGVLIMPDGKGGFVVDNVGVKRAGVSLVMGKNILSADLEDNNEDRFSIYHAKSQDYGADTTEAEALSLPQATSYDRDIKRYRPLVFQPEDSYNEEDLNKRAQWESAIRAARAQSMRIEVSGWRQNLDKGALWDVNMLVPVKIPNDDIDSMMLIKAVEFSYNENEGAKTTLSLVHPDSYIKEPIIEKREI
tara:strand:- start:112 stop:1134 length:1023 start_codon:yes stop_codon:yes gene_type:complete